MKQYSIFEDTADFVVFTFDNYLCLLYKTKVTVEAIQSSYVCFKQMLKAYDKLFFVGVIPANLEAPSTDVSTAIRGWLRDVGDNLTASVVIHQDVGWRLPIVRGITASIAWLAKVPFPHKAFASVPEATFWLHSHYQTDGHRAREILESAISDLQGAPLPKAHAKPEQTLS